MNKSHLAYKNKCRALVDMDMHLCVTNAEKILTIKISGYQVAVLYHIVSQSGCQSDPMREHFGCLKALAALLSETSVSCTSGKSWLITKSGLDVLEIPTIRVYVSWRATSQRFIDQSVKFVIVLNQTPRRCKIRVSGD